MSPMPTTDQLVESLIEAAPAGWGRIEVVVRATVLVYDFAASAHLSNGAAVPFELPGAFLGGCQRLREEMYEPGRGTWFSLRIVLDAQQGSQVEVNFDDDPQWSVPPHPTSYLRDVEVFPRDEEHTPAWLRALVEQGREAEQHRVG